MVKFFKKNKLDTGDVLVVILLMILAGFVGIKFFGDNSSSLQQCQIQDAIEDIVLNYDHNLQGSTLDFRARCNQRCDGEGYAKSGQIFKVGGGLTTDMHLKCVCIG